MIKALAILPLLFIAGCSNDPEPQVDPAITAEAAPEAAPKVSEQVFIDVIREQIPEFAGVSDATLIKQGHIVCNYFDVAGVSKETFLQGAQTFVSNSTVDMTLGDAGAFFGAATATYCPATNEQLSAAMAGRGA